MARRVLDVRGLQRSFGPLRVLAGVDLAVDAGEIVALVGENGAGKSTLVRCLAGDLPPDAGEILVAGAPLGRTTVAAAAQGVSVVWQDLSLCDNLDVAANVFLGNEGRRLLWADQDLHIRAGALMRWLGVPIDDVRVPLTMLSGGQRQAVALARATLQEPRVLVLDEAAAALGVNEARAIERVINHLRERGAAVLMISHSMEQVFALADRVLVLRQGRVVADISPRESHPDDVLALMAGAEVDTTARRQLRRLHSLVDQLAEVAPAASLPLIVSALASALDQERLCVHLVDRSDPGILRRTAAIGLPSGLLAANVELPVGAGGGSVGRAVASGELVIVDDITRDAGWTPFRDAAIAAGVRSAWAAPIVGSNGVALGSVSGYGDAVGRPPPEQVELISLYASHAASAIERERLLDTVTRRNRVLEGLRGILEALAGPDRVRLGLVASLEALRGALGAGSVAIIDAQGAPVAVAGSLSDAGERSTVALAMPDGADGELVASWASGTRAADARELLRDAGRSLQLALEGEALADARREADALRRSHTLQRALLQRLSHELRTPLTAVHGYATTLLQTDVVWDEDAEGRFLGAIVAESDRLRRLVSDLLDSSAIESGLLRLAPDWCDPALVVRAAARCVDVEDHTVRLDLEPELPPVWADHDRLQQVLVNLIDNAVRHGGPTTGVTVSAAVQDGSLILRVRDDGPGVPANVSDRLFDPHVRGDTGGAGLGLAIARGIALAHGGSLELEEAVAGACFRLELPVEAPQGADSELWWEVDGRA